MIRTIVVDDEPYIRKSIISSIETTHPDFQVIAEAGNGVQAYQKIIEFHPDVVFVDIRMPVMDGIALLEKLYQERISPIRVILSGYSEFEYAKKAIQFDVFDYILKPIHFEPFTKLLSEISERLHKKRSEEEYEYFHYLLKGIKPSNQQKDLADCMRRYQNFACFYLIVGSYMYTKNNQFNPVGNFPDPEFLSGKIAGLCTSKEQVWSVSGENQNEMLFIIGTTGNAPLPAEKLASQIYQICSDIPVPITLVFTSGKAELDTLQELAISLKYTAIQKIRFGTSSLIKYHIDEPEMKPESLLPESKFTELQSSVRDKRYQDFKRLVKESLGFFSKNKICQQQLKLELIRILEMLGGHYLTSEMQDFVDEILTNSIDYENLTSSLLEYVDDYTKDYYKDLTQDLANMIRDYIDQHYDKPLTLGEIADYFHISPSYLSTVFKKSYAVSPNEYIMNKRISKAKDLLSVFPPVPVKQIAEMIGYSDPFYFSRIFKMTTGKTPTEYRVLNV